MVAGDIKVSLAEVELLTIRIRLLICSIDKAEQIGLDWWKYDHHLSPGKHALSAENEELRKQVRALERSHLLPQLVVLGRQRLFAGRQVVIVLPPIEANLLGFVDRADEQPDPDGQQLDFRERNLDISRDDEPLVEDTVENINQTRGTSVSLCECRRHKFGILRTFRALAID